MVAPCVAFAAVTGEISTAEAKAEMIENCAALDLANIWIHFVAIRHLYPMATMRHSNVFISQIVSTLHQPSLCVL
jgi:hypothetical protein